MEEKQMATNLVGSQSPETSKRPTMMVKVYAPFQVFFDGEAFSVSATNDVGPFDILPKHKNFICMLVPGDLRVESAKGLKSFKISRALMHVKADQVTIFVDV